MKTVTITIFVKPNDVVILTQVLTILDRIDIENNYVFTPSDISFNLSAISNWVRVNIPIDLYVKFSLKYNELSK